MKNGFILLLGLAAAIWFFHGEEERPIPAGGSDGVTVFSYHADW